MILKKNNSGNYFWGEDKKIVFKKFEFRVLYRLLLLI
jgi:hypothetical protein